MNRWTFSGWRVSKSVPVDMCLLSPPGHSTTATGLLMQLSVLPLLLTALKSEFLGQTVIRMAGQSVSQAVLSASLCCYIYSYT